MEQARTLVVRCEATYTPLYRCDREGRGVFIWCRGHHREEFKTWEELGLTREVLESLLEEIKSHE